MPRLKTLMAGWARIEMAVCLLLLAVIVTLILYQVLARYAFNAPLAWSEEFTTYCFIWLVLVAGSLVAKEGRHIVVDIWPTGATRTVLRKAMTLLAIAGLGVVVANTAPIIAVEMRTTTIALPLNFPKAFVFSLPMLYAFVSIIMTLLVDLFAPERGD